MYYIKEYYNALPYEKVVQTKLKGTDVYKRYVDITDNKNIDYSDIFENLESIKAIRKKDSALVISFDTKKQSVFDKTGNMLTRKIISYCFSVLMPDGIKAIQILFINNSDKDIRLSVSECLSFVLHFCYESGQFNTLYYSNKFRLTYYDNKSNEMLIKRFNTLKDVKTFTNEHNIDGLIFKSDRSHVSAEKAKKLTALKTNVCLLGHASIKDITAFSDRSDYRFLNGLNSLQGGIVTLNSNGGRAMNLGVKDYEKNYYEYPISYVLRDSECYSPNGDKTLNPMKKCLKLDTYNKEYKYIDECALDIYNENFDKFCTYASQDSLISLIYTAKIWGVNKSMPVSITSASATYLYDKILEYFKINGKTSKEIEKAFKHKYEGFNAQTRLEMTSSGNAKSVSYYNKTYDADKIDRLGQKSYIGGYNICPYPGVFSNVTYDFDLINAYPTALCLIPDIDWDNPINKEILEQNVTLDFFDNINDVVFGEVDFEFPATVKYPNIPVRVDDSIVFPRKGTHVCATGSAIYLALQLGAKVYAHDLIKANVLYNDDGTRSMCFRCACKQLVNDRETCKNEYGKKSLQEIIIKLLNNGGYGKVGQCVTDKGECASGNAADDMRPSIITSKYRAAMVTGLVRDYIIAIANQLNDRGYNFYSSTTDGFISDVPFEVLESLDAYGFTDLFKEARMYLTGNSAVWSEKHKQDSLLLNFTTRGNVGFGEHKDDDKCVCAHAGFKTGEPEDSYSDRLSLFKIVVTRTDKPKYIYDLWSNLKDVIKKKNDFTITKCSKSANFNFDLKRKPIFETMYEVEGTYDGITYKYAVFDTEPYRDVEEYKLYKEIGKTFDCLRTVEDWNKFQMRLRLKLAGTTLNITDLEWTKLLSVVRLYNQGKVSIPALDECKTIKEKIFAINIFNHSDRIFTETTWKSCCRNDRMSQVLELEDLKDLLNEIGAVLINAGEQSSI